MVCRQMYRGCMVYIILMLLFVLTKQTRGIASMIETAEYIKDKRRVYLVVEEMDEDDYQNNVKDFKEKLLIRT